MSSDIIMNKNLSRTNLILESYDLKDAFKKLIESALSKFSTKMEAAKALGITHWALNRQITKYKIKI